MDKVRAKLPAARYWPPQANPSRPRLKYSATVRMGYGRPRFNAKWYEFCISSAASHRNCSLKSISRTVQFPTGRAEKKHFGIFGINGIWVEKIKTYLWVLHSNALNRYKLQSSQEFFLSKKTYMVQLYELKLCAMLTLVLWLELKQKTG